jgi:hypothetical protein
VGFYDVNLVSAIISIGLAVPIFSIHHHTADLSDILISCCVITTNPENRTTTKDASKNSIGDIAIKPSAITDIL